MDLTVILRHILSLYGGVEHAQAYRGLYIDGFLDETGVFDVVEAFGAGRLGYPEARIIM